MFQKQISNVQVTFTGFDYCHVAAIVRPAIQASQYELVHKADRSPNGNVLPTDEPSVPHGSVGSPTVDVYGQPVTNRRLDPTTPIQESPRRTRHRQIDLNQPGFLRLTDVLAIIPVSRATWYSGVKSGLYPPSVSLGGSRSVGWSTSAIKKLIDELSATSATSGSQAIKSKQRGDFTT